MSLPDMFAHSVLSSRPSMKIPAPKTSGTVVDVLSRMVAFIVPAPVIESRATTRIAS